jgi:hypothetical protein
MWVRLESLIITEFPDAAGVLFDRKPRGLSGPAEESNRITVSILDAAGPTSIGLSVVLTNFDGSRSDEWRRFCPVGGGMPFPGRHDNFPNGRRNAVDVLNGGWHLISIVFNGSPSVSTSVCDVYTNAVRLTAASVHGFPTPVSFSEATGIVQDSLSDDSVTFNANAASLQNGADDQYNGQNTISTGSPGFELHGCGMWNVPLTGLEISYLYNSGDGWEINWRENAGAYVSAPNLVHYWQMGAIVDLDFFARDTGIHPFGGDLNPSEEITNAHVTDEPGYDDKLNLDKNFPGNISDQVQYPGKPQPG